MPSKARSRVVGRDSSRIATFRQRAVPAVTHFQGFSLDGAEFEQDGDGDTIVKEALVMVEGTHIDSQKRKHHFPAERIQEIVENTNRFLEKGGRVPWQQDHQKTQNANIGDLGGPLELRVITESDLPDRRLKHLVGKVGAFASELVGKGKDVVQMIRAGRIKTLSPGIDVQDNIIREISATPTPAIVGLSTFKAADTRSARFALTWDEMEAESQDMDAFRQEYEDLSETFWELMKSISQAGEEELQGGDPGELQMQAIDEFSMRLQSLFGLDGSPTEEEMMAQQGMAPAPPGYPQGGYTPGTRPPGGRFSQFSIEGIEREARLERLAEFARRTRRDKGRKRGKRRPGTAVKVGLGLAGVGAVVGVGALAMRNKKSTNGANSSSSGGRSRGTALPSTTVQGALERKMQQGGGRTPNAVLDNLNLGRVDPRRKAQRYSTGSLGKENVYGTAKNLIQRINQRDASRKANSLTFELNQQRRQSRGMALPSQPFTKGPNPARAPRRGSKRKKR